VSRIDLNPGAEAKRVLIIKLSALGDFVMALGGIEAVRKFHPGAEITLLTTPFLREFAEACPYIDVVQTNGRPSGIRGNYALLRDISKSRFDIVYDFQTSNRTNSYWKFLKRIPQFKTPLWSGAVEGQKLFHAAPLRHTMHPVDRIADQLRYAGHVIPPASQPVPNLSWVRTSLGDTPDLQPAHFDLPEKYTLLIPGASAHRSAKRWPEEQYAALSSQLLERGITPAIIGGPSEKDIAAEIAKQEPRTENLVGRTSLFQIVTLAERAVLVIGNDTGPMHMSTLAGAKGVALFATDESDPRQACPRGAPVKTVYAPRADGISVERVVKAVDVMLTHGALSKKQLLEALAATPHQTCGLKLLNGTNHIGWLGEIGGTKFEFSNSGPLAPEEPFELSIEDLDPYSLIYWQDGSNIPIDLHLPSA